MCEVTNNSIKLCSCADNLDLNKRESLTNYIWIFERVVGDGLAGMLGMALLPKEQLDDLKPEFIVQELNAKNVFDFEYQPQENDCLVIERVDREEGTTREYLYGEYLSFTYSEGVWEIGILSPFEYEIEEYKRGCLRLVASLPIK